VVGSQALVTEGCAIWICGFLSLLDVPPAGGTNSQHAGGRQVEKVKAKMDERDGCWTLVVIERPKVQSPSVVE
jgi:hypothetical protein